MPGPVEKENAADGAGHTAEEVHIALPEDHPSPRSEGQQSPGLRNSKGWDGKLRVERTATLANPEILESEPESDDENVMPGEEVAADEGKSQAERLLSLPRGANYGNEVEVGQGVARAIKEGLVKREDLFLVSKIWNTFHDGDKVEPIARKQLADLGIDYFDLYIVHFPVSLEYVDPSVRYPPGWYYDGEKEIRLGKATIQETWQAFESLVDKGLAKSIGISNFQGQLVYDLLRYARIRPATLQIEHHPYLTQEDLVRLAKNEGIAVTAYSTFGPTSFDEFDWPHAKALTPLLKHDLISSLASKYGKDPSQILLRWCTQRGLAVIPKTTRPQVMTQNLDVTGFDMAQEDVDSISALNINTRFNKPNHYVGTEILWIFG